MCFTRDLKALVTCRSCSPAMPASTEVCLQAARIKEDLCRFDVGALSACITTESSISTMHGFRTWSAVISSILDVSQLCFLDLLLSISFTLPDGLMQKFRGKVVSHHTSSELRKMHRGHHYIVCLRCGSTVPYHQEDLTLH